MPTSLYQGDVSVQIAFNAGTRTPAASYVWTDVSTYVELEEIIDITWGRQDERSNADANQLRLTLDNSDGRFTFGKTTGAYYPNVKIGRPIRVKIDPVDGAEATYFLGFVNEWPTEWNGTDAYAKATITASSRLSRLGMIATLRSVVESAVLADSPFCYYTLGDPADSTAAAESSGRGGESLPVVGTDAPIVFGNATGPDTDGLTAAEFGGGVYLHGATPLGTASGGFSIECFFLASSAPVGSAASLIFLNGNTGQVLSLQIETTGRPTASFPAFSAFGPSSVCDGQTHHLAAVWVDGGDVTLYVDGVSVATTGFTSAITGSMIDISVGTRLIATVAHVAGYGTALSAAAVLSHANSGLTGYVGDTTSARLVRYAGFAGIASAEVSTETGQTTMVHVDTTGKQVVELMRICETTEGGVLYDERDGTLTFDNRAHRYVVASAFTLNMAEQEVEADYLPKVDRTGLANDVTVNGINTVHRIDTTSRDDYGQATLSIDTASEDDEAPLNLASWNLYKFKDPKERVPALTVDALAQVGKTPNCSAVLAATVGTKITVSNRPTQAATSSVDYFIEGGAIRIGPELLRVTWNLSPSSPEDQTLVIGDATRGFIGTNPIAF